MDDWFDAYVEYCQIMGIEKNKRDEILFTAGYTFSSIESVEEE
jgi:hypothetical protein